jgi:uracil-DNA glycosylase
LSPNKIKVVILGQDPYHSFDRKNSSIPLAMGQAFSVPIGADSSSLNNIFNNLIKYKQIKKKPSHGNLMAWVKQGVFLFNMALTVEKGRAGEHLSEWHKFTDLVIEYLNKNCEDLVFLIWGSHSLEKVTKGLIDKKKHKVIISSHPSGFSYNKPLKNYSAFNETDHFGKANKYLKKHGIKQIDWNI